MDVRTRRVLHGLLLVLGLTLIVVGIGTGKHGASIVGLIVAAVNVRQWQQWNKQGAAAGRGHPQP